MRTPRVFTVPSRVARIRRVTYLGTSKFSSKRCIAAVQTLIWAGTRLGAMRCLAIRTLSYAERDPEERPSAYQPFNRNSQEYNACEVGR